MGAFNAAVSEQPNLGTKSQRIRRAMQRLEDGSWEELCVAMHDPDITSVVIANAIGSAVDITISSRTVAQWRNNKTKMQTDFAVS